MSARNVDSVELSSSSYAIEAKRGVNELDQASFRSGWLDFYARPSFLRSLERGDGWLFPRYIYSSQRNAENFSQTTISRRSNSFWKYSFNPSDVVSIIDSFNSTKRKYEKDRLRNAAKIRRGCVRVEITFERRERGEGGASVSTPTVVQFVSKQRFMHSLARWLNYVITAWRGFKRITNSIMTARNGLQAVADNRSSSFRERQLEIEEASLAWKEKLSE